MKTEFKGLRTICLATALIGALAMVSPVDAQQRNRNSGGRTSSGRSGYSGRSGTSGRSTFGRTGGYTGGRTYSGGYTGGRTSSGGRTYTGGSAGGRSSSGGRTYTGGYTGGRTYGHATQGRTYGGYSGGRTYGSYGGGYGRAQTFSPRVGVVMGADQWRHYHPGWNGHYYYRNGGYFFDPLFEYPAVVPFAWDTIIGGLGFGITLYDDPYVYFSGEYGDLFPVDELNVYLSTGTPVWRARAAFFNHPYFYRNGTEFVRQTVYRGGREYYRFARR